VQGAYVAEQRDTFADDHICSFRMEVGDMPKFTIIERPLAIDGASDPCDSVMCRRTASRAPMKLTRRSS
jgi:hypothetical protein